MLSRKLLINKMLIATACALVFCVALFFASCKSGARFSVPGGQTAALAAIHAEYLSLGDAYTELEKYAEATRYYRLAMRDRDIYWTALYKFGRTSALAKNWADARDAYEKLLERDSANTGLRLSLAYIDAMSGNLDAAKTEYENLINELPENETPLSNYIAILLSQEDFDTAETQVSLLKERFPDSESLADFEKRLAAARDQNSEGAEATSAESTESSTENGAESSTDENAETSTDESDESAGQSDAEDAN